MDRLCEIDKVEDEKRNKETQLERSVKQVKDLTVAYNLVKNINIEQEKYYKDLISKFKIRLINANKANFKLKMEIEEIYKVYEGREIYIEKLESTVELQNIYIKAIEKPNQKVPNDDDFVILSYSEMLHVMKFQKDRLAEQELLKFNLKQEANNLQMGYHPVLICQCKNKSLTMSDQNDENGIKHKFKLAMNFLFKQVLNHPLSLSFFVAICTIMCILILN